MFFRDKNGAIDLNNNGYQKTGKENPTYIETAKVNKMTSSEGNGTSNGTREPAYDATETNRKKLILRIKESTDEYQDKMMLDDLKRLLLNSSGIDDVALEIETAESLVFMEWYPVKVNVSRELEDDLNSVLGASGKVSIQSSMF